MFRLNSMIVCLTLAFTQLLSAQSVWLNRDLKNSISMEILKPDVNNVEGLSFTTSAIFLSGFFQLGENVKIITELPFAHYGYHFEYGYPGNNESYNETQNALGNPYLGLELGNSEINFYGEIGVRLPLMSQEKTAAGLMGRLSDIDRLEAFFPDYFALSLMANPNTRTGSGVNFQLRFGPIVWIKSNSESFGDGQEVFAVYGVYTGYSNNKVHVKGGISGRYLITEESEDFGSASWHVLTLEGNVSFGRFWPGFTIKLPLDGDLSQSLDSVFGLQLTIDLE